MSIRTVLTRRELYDLVWSKPTKDLAADFGVSDVGIAKICDRHRVPKPGRGYWAKLRAGQKVTKTLFREVDNPALNRIELRSGIRQLPSAAQEVLKRARAERQAAKSLQPGRAAPIPVAATGEVHASIKPTAQALRKAKPDAKGAVEAIGDGLCGVDVAVANVERVIALLDALARKLDARSLPLTPTAQAMRVAVGPDSATFTITERTRREKHVPTPGDLAAEDRRQKRLQRYWHSSPSSNDAGSSLFTRAYPEFDVIYTGVLVFQIEGYSEGVRRTWADGKTQTVEALLDDITVGLEAVLAVRKAHREEREEWQRRWQELARRRELARKRAEREQKRAAYLNRLINVHSEVASLQKWLADVQAAPKSSGLSGFAQLTNWARQRLANLETMIDSERIDQDLEDQGLFPEIDELHDPEGDPSEEPSRW
jgi:hypothetical protein